MLWRNLVGPDFSNPTGLVWGPKAQTLNEITPALTLGFGGDVMSMFDKPLQVHESVRAFFAPCDHVVLNFEGVVTSERQIAPDQKHTPAIAEVLKALAPAERLLLSLANNHAGDYGEEAAHACASWLTAQGLRHFGLSQSPTFDLAPQVRVITGTEWSNREGQHLAWLQEPGPLCKPGAMNIAYPHWGFELEAFPRRSLVARAERWLEQVDAIVGHHCHMPQPVDTREHLGMRRPVAYSLGDLCFGLASNRRFFWPYQWGSVLRMTVGPWAQDPSRWAVGELQWAFVRCGPSVDGLAQGSTSSQGQWLALSEHCDLLQAPGWRP